MVDQMEDQNRAYFFKKRVVYYFSKRIPSDLKHLYQVERLTRSLRTKCERKAKSQVQAMLLKLDDHWSKARLHNDILHSKSLNQNKVIKFTESVSEYLSANGPDRSITFEKAVQSASRYLVACVGGKVSKYQLNNHSKSEFYLPFTTFHLIAGTSVKSVSPHYFSFTTFALTNVIIDSKVIYYLFMTGIPSYKLFHTFLELH